MSASAAAAHASQARARIPATRRASRPGRTRAHIKTRPRSVDICLDAGQAEPRGAGCHRRHPAAAEFDDVGARAHGRGAVSGGFVGAVALLWHCRAGALVRRRAGVVSFLVLALLSACASTRRSASRCRPSSRSCRCCSRCRSRSCRSRSCSPMVLVAGARRAQRARAAEPARPDARQRVVRRSARSPCSRIAGVAPAARVAGSCSSPRSPRSSPSTSRLRRCASGSRAARRSPSSCGEAWVYVVDAALSGVALLVAEQIHRLADRRARAAAAARAGRAVRARAPPAPREPARAQRAPTASPATRRSRRRT